MTRYWIKLEMIVILCLCIPTVGNAKVKLSSLISDGMVLQRNHPIRIWGHADPSEKISVSFMKECFNTIADSSGNWDITLPPMKAGGPYPMEINELQLTNIMIGDVWLCAGQSNMELPVARVTEMFAKEISSYNNEKIRQFLVSKEYNFHAPMDEIQQGEWKMATQENVMSFSALAYFFAKIMYEKDGVPIGIINSSWGGTPIESWISEDGLRDFPLYINEKRLYENDAYCELIKKVERESFQRWNTTLYNGDQGLHEATPWYAPHYDDSDWTTVDMFSRDWGNNGLNPIGGSHWLRQNIEVPKTWENQPVTLRLGCIIDADSVYVNGVFVGSTSYQYPPRIYQLPAGLLKEGTNNITIRIISNGGQPSFVKEKPYKLICQMNDETETIPLSTYWKYHLGAPMPSAPSMMFFCYEPTGLYNAMIAPLKNYTINGTIWYQGESNVARRNEYASLLSTMISDWRRTFQNQELDFYIVELADFLSPDDINGRKAWAEMRQEQAKVATNTAHTRLIKNSDLGEWNDVHPLDKKTLGHRIADAVVLKNKQ